ncbi:putative ABC transport system permease protein [Sanguibacter gelidistatuariae]|uniref:Putative ABC transport system permease protein n=1 Tax=Sanguibacter gelidistatuariae TaxID=1814289 RepID=A0A1G6HK65_9MICO|nr:putative ABC transport system permease protein [Sanguibacter gelidistatuariae]
MAVLVGLPIMAGAVAAVLWSAATPSDEVLTRQMLGETTQAKVDWHGAAIMQLPGLSGGTAQTANGSIEARTMTEVEAILRTVLPPGDAVHPQRTFAVEMVAGAAEVQSSGVERDSTAAEIAGMVRLTRGRLPDHPGEVALSAAVARTLDVVATDVVDLYVLEPSNGPARRGEKATVVVTGVVESIEGAGVLMPVGTSPLVDDPRVTSWLVTGPEPVTWDDVQGFNAAGFTVVSWDVVRNPPLDSDVPMIAELGVMTTSQSRATIGIVGAAVVFGLFEIILLIGPAFAVGARRNERMLALVASVGGDRATLRRVVLAGGLVIGFGASLVAVAVGIVLSVLTVAVVRRVQPLALAGDVLPVPALVMIVAAGTAIAVVAAWLPARGAARTDVAAVLAGRRGEARPRRRVPVVGVILLVSGIALALAGAVTRSPVLVVAGVTGMLVGVVASSGGIVTLVSRAAPWLGPAGRFAVRDAARQRSRTAPAIAAVIAAIAGLVAAASFAESKDARDLSIRSAVVAEGVVVVTQPAPAVEAGSVEQEGDPRQTVTDVLEAMLPVTAVHEVRTAAYDPAGLTEQDAASAAAHELYLWVSTAQDPAQVCPAWREGVEQTEELWAAAAQDSRCFGAQDSTTPISFGDSGSSQVIVDDGTVLEATGLPGAATAAQALRDGLVVVSDASHVWPDGAARVEVELMDFQSSGEPSPTTVVLPAVHVDLPRYQYGVVLPPQVLGELGLISVPVGYVGVTDRMPTEAEEAAAQTALTVIEPEAAVFVERGFDPTDTQFLMAVLVAIALVVGLVATAIVMTLAAAETRPDMATLGAVGAAPRTRRRIASAQAGLVTGIGTVLGAGIGVAFAWVLVLTRRHEYSQITTGWSLHVPWIQVLAITIGVPVCASLGAYLLTRSQLPITARLSS